MALPEQQGDRRRLVLLTLAVAGAHAALLAGLAGALRLPAPPPPPPPAVLLTRMLTEGSPPAAAVPTEAAPQVRAPRPAPPPPPAPSPTPAPQAATPPPEPPAAPSPPTPPTPPAPMSAEQMAGIPESMRPQYTPLSRDAGGAVVGPFTPPSPQQTAAAPVRLPEPVTLDYAVAATIKGLPNRGDAQLVWQHDGSQYEAQLTLDSLALRLFGQTRVQTSRGRIGAQGIAPQRFSDKTRAEQAVHFSDDGREATFSANRPAQPLEPGAQDRLSLVLQLAGLLQADPARYPVGTRIALQAVDAREAQNWTFLVESTEPLDLPAGRLDTLRLVREARKEYDSKVEFWFAPSTGWLPVRTRITYTNGDVLDQQLRRLP